MERIEFCKKWNYSNEIVIEKAFPFYFAINSNNIGTLSFLCISNEDEKFALHCNYKLEDYELDVFNYCKICNKALTLSQNLVNTELIKSLPNFLTDLCMLNIAQDNPPIYQFSAVKIDNKGNITDEFVIFDANINILNIFGATNDFICNYETSGALEYITTLNFLSNDPKEINIFEEDSDISIYKMAPNGTERKTRDVLVWLKIKQSDKEYSIICRFLLDNPLKKRKFKKITKEALEIEYLKSEDDNLYIANFMYDMDLYGDEAESSFVLLTKRNSTKEHVYFNLIGNIKDKIINLIENY